MVMGWSFHYKKPRLGFFPNFELSCRIRPSATQPASNGQSLPCYKMSPKLTSNLAFKDHFNNSSGCADAILMFFANTLYFCYCHIEVWLCYCMAYKISKVALLNVHSNFLFTVNSIVL